MRRTGEELPRVEVRSREELRAWLSEHHASSGSIWLVSYKRVAGDLYLPYDGIVAEALCFGWIDSMSRELDAERSMHLLAPRKPGSGWSRSNKVRVEKLVATGLMAPAGLAKIQQAKADGSWSKLDEVEALVVPPDLAAALDAQPLAATHFEAFPRSSKRQILEWILQAKRPETRAERVRQTAERAARNERAR